MRTLDSLKAGDCGVVHGLHGGQNFLSKITAMGFIPDTQVTMISNRRHGPVIVYLRDTNVALGRGEAVKISIQEEEK